MIISRKQSSSSCCWIFKKHCPPLPLDRVVTRCYSESSEDSVHCSARYRPSTCLHGYSGSDSFRARCLVYCAVHHASVPNGFLYMYIIMPTLRKIIYTSGGQPHLNHPLPQTHDGKTQHDSFSRDQKPNKIIMLYHPAEKDVQICKKKTVCLVLFYVYLIL